MNNFGNYPSSRDSDWTHIEVTPITVDADKYFIPRHEVDIRGNYVYQTTHGEFVGWANIGRCNFVKLIEFGGDDGPIEGVPELP